MRRTWTWTFDLPPDQLCPVLADTNRFNEGVRLPPDPLDATPQPNGTASVLTRGSFRRFGPVFDLESDGDGGSRVTCALGGSCE
jgi:hypothetical protein